MPEEIKQDDTKKIEDARQKMCRLERERREEDERRFKEQERWHRQKWESLSSTDRRKIRERVIARFPHMAKLRYWIEAHCIAIAARPELEKSL